MSEHPSKDHLVLVLLLASSAATAAPAVFTSSLAAADVSSSSSSAAAAAASSSSSWVFWTEKFAYNSISVLHFLSSAFKFVPSFRVLLHWSWVCSIAPTISNNQKQQQRRIYPTTTFPNRRVVMKVYLSLEDSLQDRWSDDDDDDDDDNAGGG
jgi:hypothetical protein